VAPLPVHAGGAPLPPAISPEQPPEPDRTADAYPLDDPLGDWR
jgi:hypothetical protein